MVKDKSDFLNMPNLYNFQVNRVKVNVVFSNKQNAPTIETALVKIATGRLE